MSDVPPKRRKKSARPYHHGDLRRVVLETAAAMVREQKTWQFTLREVARRAGVSHTAPYNHFADKGALLAELAMGGFDALRMALEASRPKRPGAFRDEYFAVARAYVRFGTENPGLYRLMFSQDVGYDVHMSERSVAAFGVMLELLARGQATGAIKKARLRAQAAACWAAVHGITTLCIEGLFEPAIVGKAPVDAALATLFEGLAP
jgi:AcrR family transcriptional regulator